MGVAILSGVLDSQRSQQTLAAASMASSVSSLQDSMAGDDLTELPSRYIATVNRLESVRRLKKTFSQYPDIEIHAGNNVQAAREADVILLGCKPQMVQDIIAEPGMKDALDGKLVISICAGLRISQMTAWVHPNTKVVRAMPNTPCKIREGMTILTPLPPTLPNAELDRNILLSIFSAVGRCRFLDEKHFDACTALRSCLCMCLPRGDGRRRCYDGVAKTGGIGIGRTDHAGSCKNGDAKRDASRGDQGFGHHAGRLHHCRSAEFGGWTCEEYSGKDNPGRC